MDGIVKHSPLTEETFGDKGLNFWIEKRITTENIGRHWHECLEIMLVLNGSGTHFLNSTPFRVRRGYICLIHPGDFHELIIDKTEPFEMIDMLVSHNFVSGQSMNQVRYHNRDLSKYLDERKLEVTQYVCEKLLGEYNGENPMCAEVIRNGFEWMMLNIFHSENYLDNESLRKEKIEQVIMHINNSFMREITLEQVAKMVHLSRGYFSQYFKEEMGVTFQEYLQNLRLNFALELIKTSDLSISEICFRTGFNSAAYFSRAFKKHFGNSPRFYRNHNKKSDF